ncbi:YafY family transcriptional regulator [Rhodococcus erythropolis]|uniref:helix-turn-helix transcriptional regulator n=1 Tax=Rhodococcus erythropolis TaxID=1833 RepID=UPI00210BCD2A|nr:YafY family protein [Rhodococcus erythropolis]MCQ4125245.1 YafY family transcriptional regulator [Rhodococcus erythropolis]
MRSDRLLATLLLLQTHQRLSAKEIAGRLEVSTRTVMRDVEALSAAGVPVYTERGRFGGISILPDFTTDVTGLTGDEAKSLFMLMNSRAHADLGLGDAMASALRKVMAALPQTQRDSADFISSRILIDPVRWGRQHDREPAASAVFDTVQRAVLEDLRVSMRYRPRTTTTAQRYLVDPYGLVNKAGTWYLIADHRQRPRLFRADRIVAASVSGDRVQRRDGVDLGELWAQLRAGVENFPEGLDVVVRVSKASIGRFLIVHGADLVEPPPIIDDPDGLQDSWNLTVRMRSVGASQTLLAFGGDITVLSPIEVREHLHAIVGDLAAAHPSPDPSDGEKQ